jgi:hypothetical protein
MSGVRIYITWPYRSDAIPHSSRLDATLAALAPIGFTGFTERNQSLDKTSRIFERAASRCTARLEVIGQKRGRRIGSVCGRLLLDAPPDGALANELVIERMGPAAPAAIRALLNELVDLWSPLWGFIGTLQAPDVPSGPWSDGAPTVGWLTYLSSLYGAIPNELDARPARNGSIVEAKVEGRFDHAVFIHDFAVRCVTRALDAAYLLAPLADLRRRGLRWQDERWQVDARVLETTQPIAPKAPTITTPSYLQTRLEAIPALAGTAPIDDRAMKPALPFRGAGLSMSLHDYAAMFAELELAPAKRSEIEARYGLSPDTSPLLELRWKQRFDADPTKAAEFKRRLEEARASLRKGPLGTPQK